MAREPSWEHFDHGSDVGVRGRGPTLEAAFEQAALALTGIVCDPARVEERERLSFECSAPNDALLLADWLNALIAAMSARRVLFRRYAVRIDGHQLSGTAWGEEVDRARHEPAAEPKGATYTALAVKMEEDGGWLAQCVVDV